MKERSLATQSPKFHLKGCLTNRHRPSLNRDINLVFLQEFLRPFDLRVDLASRDAERVIVRESKVEAKASRPYGSRGIYDIHRRFGTVLVPRLL